MDLETWKKRLAEIRDIKSDAQLVAQLIGAMEAMAAFEHLNAYEKPAVIDENSIADYFNSVVLPGKALNQEREAIAIVIRERLAAGNNHPELKRVAGILQKTTEYPEGHRWIDGYTVEDTLKFLKRWQKTPSLPQRIKSVFKPA